jgi:HEAT repeat protein
MIRLRNKRRIAFAAAITMGMVGIIWIVTRPREPVYQGKRVGEYINDLALIIEHNSAPVPEMVRQGIQPDDPAIKAICAIAPEAIPYLRRAIRRKDSWQEKGLAFLRAKLPSRLSKRLPQARPMYLIGLREGAIRSCAAIGPSARELLPDLIGCFNDLRARNMAYYAVCEIGPQPENLTALIAILKTSGDRGARAYAAACIGKSGIVNRESISALTTAAQGPDPLVPIFALEALANLGPKAQSALPEIESLAKSPNRVIRVAAAGALWKIQGDTNRVIAMAMRELDDEIHGPTPSSSSRDSMHSWRLTGLCTLFGDIGPPAKAVAPRLRVALDEPSVPFAFSAALALWKITRETNGILPVCQATLGDFDPNLRLRAVELLTEICAETHMPVPNVEKLLKSDDSFVRFYVARAMWKISADTERAIPILIEGLQDHFTYYRNTDIRKLAAETLGEMGTNARIALPALNIALKDGQLSVRIAATNALMQIERRSSHSNILQDKSRAPIRRRARALHLCSRIHEHNRSRA